MRQSTSLGFNFRFWILVSGSPARLIQHSDALALDLNIGAKAGLASFSRLVLARRPEVDGLENIPHTRDLEH